MLHALEARYSAIATLQAARLRHIPGSFRYEQIEHAIDLVLNDSRAVNDFLVRNVLRDAARTNSRRSAKRVLIQVAEDYEYRRDDETGDTASEVLQESTTPFHICESTQIVEAIVIAVSHHTNHARRVVEGVLLGETLAETALAIGISTDRVNQIRRMIRDEAAKLLEVRNVQ